MKIAAWHKLRGDTVEWYTPLLSENIDIVYMSKIFSFSKDYEFPINAKKIIKGGSGYCIELKNGKEIYNKNKDTPLAYEIEHIKPDYSIYGIKDTAYGFLTRGCPHGCSFCHVATKEGTCSKKVADITEFWDGQKNIVLMDPNILACKDWRELFDQIIKTNANIDFNQGLDIRLMTKEKAEYIKQMKIKSIHFAWDKYEDGKIIKRKLQEFKNITNYDRHKITVYILCGFNTTMEQNIERIEYIRSLNMQPYVMLYNKEAIPKGHELRKLQRYVNNKFIFWSVKSFDEYGKK